MKVGRGSPQPLDEEENPMTFDLISILRDVLVLGYLVILRIGVPILITMMGGAWLRKVLEPKEAHERKVVPPVVRQTHS